MTTPQGHRHGGPPLPNFPNAPFGQPGTTRAKPLSWLFGAVTAECEPCTERLVEQVAADPLMTCHLLASSYLALNKTGQRFDQASLSELVKRYHSTAVAAWAALDRELFGDAHHLVTAGEDAEARRVGVVRDASAVWVRLTALGVLDGAVGRAGPTGDIRPE